jgi:hypothetical protein
MNLTEKFENRLNRKALFSQVQWLDHLRTKSINKDSMDRLVLDFLIKEGYKQAATDFAEEAGLLIDLSNQKNMSEKHEIRKLLLAEEIDSVIENIDKVDPDVRDLSKIASELNFKLFIACFKLI